MFHGLKAHAPARECRELIRRRLRHLLPEVFQHGLHERGVEGVGHRQWPASDPRHLSHLKQRVSKAAGRTQVVGDLPRKALDTLDLEKVCLKATCTHRKATAFGLVCEIRGIQDAQAQVTQKLQKLNLTTQRLVLCMISFWFLHLNLPILY